MVSFKLSIPQVLCLLGSLGSIGQAAPVADPTAAIGFPSFDLSYFGVKPTGMKDGQTGSTPDLLSPIEADRMSVYEPDHERDSYQDHSESPCSSGCSSIFDLDDYSSADALDDYHRYFDKLRKQRQERQRTAQTGCATCDAHSQECSLCSAGEDQTKTSSSSAPGAAPLDDKAYQEYLASLRRQTEEELAERKAYHESMPEWQAAVKAANDPEFAHLYQNFMTDEEIAARDATNFALGRCTAQDGCWTDDGKFYPRGWQIEPSRSIVEPIQPEAIHPKDSYIRENLSKFELQPGVVEYLKEARWDDASTQARPIAGYKPVLHELPASRRYGLKAHPFNGNLGKGIDVVHMNKLNKPKKCPPGDENCSESDLSSVPFLSYKETGFLNMGGNSDESFKVIPTYEIAKIVDARPDYVAPQQDLKDDGTWYWADMNEELRRSDVIYPTWHLDHNVRPQEFEAAFGHLFPGEVTAPLSEEAEVKLYKQSQIAKRQKMMELGLLPQVASS